MPVCLYALSSPLLQYCYTAILLYPWCTRVCVCVCVCVAVRVAVVVVVVVVAAAAAVWVVVAVATGWVQRAQAPARCIFMDVYSNTYIHRCVFIYVYS
jgi:hypothetical protein